MKNTNKSPKDEITKPTNSLDALLDIADDIDPKGAKQTNMTNSSFGREQGSLTNLKSENNIRANNLPKSRKPLPPIPDELDQLSNELNKKRGSKSENKLVENPSRSAKKLPLTPSEQTNKLKDELNKVRNEALIKDSFVHDKRLKDSNDKAKPVLPQIPSQNQDSMKNATQTEEKPLLSDKSQNELEDKFTISDFIKDKENWKIAGKYMAGMIGINILGAVLGTVFPPIAIVSFIASSVVFGMAAKKIYNNAKENKNNRLGEIISENEVRDKENGLSKELEPEIVNSKTKSDPERNSEISRQKDNDLIQSPQAKEAQKDVADSPQKTAKKGTAKNPGFFHNAKIAARAVGAIIGIVVLSSVISVALPLAAPVIGVIAAAACATIGIYSVRKIMQNIRINDPEHLNSDDKPKNEGKEKAKSKQKSIIVGPDHTPKKAENKDMQR